MQINTSPTLEEYLIEWPLSTLNTHIFFKTSPYDQRNRFIGFLLYLFHKGTRDIHQIYRLDRQAAKIYHPRAKLYFFVDVQNQGNRNRSESIETCIRSPRGTLTTHKFQSM
jgi:hypothetical protein